MARAAAQALIDRIQGMCVEEGDCLIWQGSVTSNGLPRATVTRGGKPQTLRKPMWEAYHAYHGTEVPAGHVVTPRCRNPLCLAKGCLVAWTVAQARAHAAKAGAYSNPARLRKTAMTLRAKSRISDAVVEVIRQAPTAIEAAQVTGVAISYVYQIREGYRRVPLVTPFSGLGA